MPRCTALALQTGSECAPAWEDGNEASEDAFQDMRHIVGCCESIQAMNKEGCFCQTDLVQSLGGGQDLSDLAKVAIRACGVEMQIGDLCQI